MTLIDANLLLSAVDASAPAHAERWLSQPGSVILAPGPRLLTILRNLLEPRGTTANLTSDARLAAIALEHGAVFCSTDRDFTRIEGLRWFDPLRC